MERLRPLVIAIATAALIALAFILGRSSGDESDSDSGASSSAASTTASGDGPTTAAGPTAIAGQCTDAAAEEATLETDFADRIRDIGAMQAELAGYEGADIPFFRGLAGYRIAVRECADLNGDGVDEMVVALSAGASGRIFQWAIFTPDESGDWQLALDREATQTSLIKVLGDRVVTKVPTYAQGEPACCPSGSKTLEFAFKDGEYQQVSPPPAPSSQRLIEASEAGVTALGKFDPLTDSPIQAYAEFGTPTSVTRINELCTHGWDDLGLTIHFVNLGGSDPCGPDGRVGSFELYGSPAAQAGWRTAKGLAVGDSPSDARSAYPGSRQDGRKLILIEVPSPFGGEGATQPILTAYIARGQVLGLQSYVGAGGE